MNPALFGAPPSDVCAPAAEGAFGADRITRTTYDAANRVDKVRTGVGVTGVEADEVTTTYTANGRVETVTDAEGNRTTYVYDGHDRLSRTRMPDPATDNSSSITDFEELTYESLAGGTRTSGLVVSRRLRDGQAIAFTYDALGRLTLADMPNSATSIFEPDISYAYDLFGRLLSATDSNTNHATFTYDALGRVTGEAGLQGATSMQYDLAGRRTRLTYPGSGLYVDFDYLVTGETAAIRENGATSGAGVLAAYAYDNLGRRASLTRGNGTTTGYSYDHASRLTQIAQDLNGTANDLILDFTHNPAGQIATNARSNDAFAWTGHYVVNRDYSANGLNQYTAAGDIEPSYDARGNLIATGGASFVYNARNQLWWAHPAAPGTALYYDPLGRMSAVIADNWATITNLLHDGDNLIAERDNASGNILRRYVHGPGTDEPLVWYEGSGTSDRRWLHADERGSIIAISNGSGAVTNVNTYDESGIPAITNVGRFQYTGQAWIAEMGVYYYRARIYSPTLGRFMQTDPIGFAGGMNLYGYVGNDPVNFIDPLGLDLEEITVVGNRPRPVDWGGFNAFLNSIDISNMLGRLTNLTNATDPEEAEIVVTGRRLARSGGLFRSQSPQQQQENCRRNRRIARALSTPSVRERAAEALQANRQTGWEYGFWTAPNNNSGDTHAFGMGTSRMFNTIVPDDMYPFTISIIINNTASPNEFWHTHYPSAPLSEDDVEWARTTGHAIVAIGPNNTFYCYP